MNLTKWLTQNALVMTIALCLTLLTNAVFWLLLTATLSFLYLFYTAFAHSETTYTYANLVTTFRFLIGALTVLFFVKLPSIYAFALFSLAIVLDGLDGYLARKYQQSSELGGLFDMTTDAFLVLVLSHLLYQHYAVSIWILFIGYLHYGYTLLLYLLKWQQLKIPKNPIGKYAAAILFGSLLSPLVVTSRWYLPIITIAASLTLVSFSISFWYKWRVFWSEQKI